MLFDEMKRTKYPYILDMQKNVLSEFRKYLYNA